MGLKLITPPAVRAVSLEEAKAHLRVSHTDDDDLIGTLIDAVIGHLEGAAIQRALVTQTWELHLDRFPGWCQQFPWYREIQLPMPPLQEVLSVKYDDTDGAEQTFSPSSYSVDAVSESGRIILNRDASWPSIRCEPNAIRIQFVAGYPPTDDSPPSLTANVPAPIKAAIKLMIGTLYENRESVVVDASVSAITLPWAADQLLMPYRIFS